MTPAKVTTRWRCEQCGASGAVTMLSSQSSLELWNAIAAAHDSQAEQCHSEHHTSRCYVSPEA